MPNLGIEPAKLLTLGWTLQTAITGMLKLMDTCPLVEPLKPLETFNLIAIH